MQKNIFIPIFLTFWLLCSATAFSAGPDVVGTNEIDLGGSGSTDNIIIGLSPQVVGAYFTNGVSTGTAQWFTIGAAHPGGNNLYATAQNLTNNYSKPFTPGTAIDKALFGLPSGPDSAVDWSTNGWK